ncbi:hypothetical protein [Sphingomonas sp. 1P08PE]|jgi:hypothetical protein|uniref:hypothetical protein n=1 Tax=Sphingomonas sp. 1P08PE TaxID=554122 RepID=UPI0039A3B77B
MATHEPEALLAVAQARIAWVLDHPNMSEWLKNALRTAEGNDPTGLWNDVEMLRHLIVPRSQAQIEIALLTPIAN